MPDHPEWLRQYNLGGSYESGFYCPRCRCNKSGSPESANLVTETCENPGCPCHDETKEMP